MIRFSTIRSGNGENGAWFRQYIRGGPDDHRDVSLRIAASTHSCQDFSLSISRGMGQFCRFSEVELDTPEMDEVSKALTERRSTKVMRGPRNRVLVQVKMLDNGKAWLLLNDINGQGTLTFTAEQLDAFAKALHDLVFETVPANMARIIEDAKKQRDRDAKWKARGEAVFSDDHPNMVEELEAMLKERRYDEMMVHYLDTYSAWNAKQPPFDPNQLSDETKATLKRIASEVLKEQK